MEDLNYKYEKPDKPIQANVPSKPQFKVNQEGGDTRWYTWTPTIHNVVNLGGVGKETTFLLGTRT